MKASIIITNYNYSKYIARCLRSCFNQHLDKKDYEVIFVDDNSIDESQKILKDTDDHIFQRDPKPDEFDPWEAYNDPSSKSYKFRQQELKQTIDSAINSEVLSVSFLTLK